MNRPVIYASIAVLFLIGGMYYWTRRTPPVDSSVDNYTPPPDETGVEPEDMDWRTVGGRLNLVSSRPGDRPNHGPRQLRSYDVRFGTLNVRNVPDLPREKVRECFRFASRHVDVLVAQEVQEAEDREDARTAMPGFLILHAGGENIIAVRASLLNATAATLTPLHEGREKVSPARGVIQSEITPVADPSFPPWFAWGSHFVSGAWNDKEKRDKLWRKAMWTRSWSIMNEVVSGHVGIYGLDANRLVVRPFGGNGMWWSNFGIDKIGRNLPDTARVKFTYLGGASYRSLPTDHPLRVVRVRVTRKD